MDNKLVLSSLHLNWNVSKQPSSAEDNNISIYLEKEVILWLNNANCNDSFRAEAHYSAEGLQN